MSMFRFDGIVVVVVAILVFTSSNAQTKSISFFLIVEVLWTDWTKF